MTAADTRTVVDEVTEPQAAIVLVHRDASRRGFYAYRVERTLHGWRTVDSTGPAGYGDVLRAIDDHGARGVSNHLASRRVDPSLYRHVVDHVLPPAWARALEVRPGLLLRVELFF